MKGRSQVLFLALLTTVLTLDQKDADEGKPYEFGFTIDGQQHRHEKKDERGIIQGEFGFITADGIYHVTVYATDENGRFKILSMRNLRISAPLDGSPFKGEISPEANKYRKQANLPPLPAVQAAPNPLSIPEVAPQQVITTPKNQAPFKFTTQPTIKPACAGCGYVTTQKPRPGAPLTPFQLPSSVFQEQDQYKQQQQQQSLGTAGISGVGSTGVLNQNNQYHEGPQTIPGAQQISQFEGPVGGLPNQGSFIPQNLQNSQNYFGGPQNTPQYPQNSNAGPQNKPPQYQLAAGPQNTNYKPVGGLQGTQYPSRGGSGDGNPVVGGENTQFTGDGNQQQTAGGSGEGTQNLGGIGGGVSNFGGNVPNFGGNGPSFGGNGLVDSGSAAQFGGSGIGGGGSEEGNGVGGNSPGNGGQGFVGGNGASGGNGPFGSSGPNAGFAPLQGGGLAAGPNNQLQGNGGQGLGGIGVTGGNTPFGGGGGLTAGFGPLQGGGLAEGNGPNYQLPGFPGANPLQIPGQGPSSEISSLPPVSVSNSVIHVGGANGQDIPIKDKFPGMQDGLPGAIEEKDITDLLYKFHYTLGFQGHYEKGLKNGAKIGGYFVNGRDGISRVVTYIADENGYRPKVRFVNLGLESEETPKAETEKRFGLKSFEFVWYPI